MVEAYAGPDVGVQTMKASEWVCMSTSASLITFYGKLKSKLLCLSFIVKWRSVVWLKCIITSF